MELLMEAHRSSRLKIRVADCIRQIMDEMPLRSLKQRVFEAVSAAQERRYHYFKSRNIAEFSLTLMFGNGTQCYIKALTH
jgi:hypothetical protein